MSHRPDHDTAGAPAPGDLDRMRAELAALGAPPMPADVTTRIGAALAVAAGDRTPARRLRPALFAGLAAAVVAGVAAVAVTVGAPAAPRVASEESDLRAAGADALGAPDAGALTDPVRRRSCLTAAGAADAGAPLLGGRPYTVRGEPGTLLVLGTGVLGRFRFVVVDAGCGPASGRLLASTTAGR
ncbi:hypothetical protein [Pseudonocardia sp. KRD291]|uniref:hypothetical protein n=1 Tax=Pseudonocardia sp. KRD291 TaxID=2792007 RepID=UPI001C4A6CCC|nr:hypothetical protein [Pseudonocardia sp. KRD291]MBW0104600.1 hypothetical protein [Pseudonocardia sp. KRD291]